MNLRYTPHARRHIEAIAEYVNERNPAAAFSVGERIRYTAALLTKFPYLGHEGSLPGTREIVVPGIPYVIVHRIEIGDQDSVIIIGVYHCAKIRQ